MDSDSACRSSGVSIGSEMVRSIFHTGLGGNSHDWNLPKFSQGLSTSVLLAASGFDVLSDARRVIFGL